MYDKSKFSFSETFNNKDGKTSGSGFIGVILGLVAAFGFVAGTVGFFIGINDTIEYLGLVLKLVGVAAVLLGARKIVGQIVESRKPEPEPEIIEDPGSKVPEDENGYA